MYFITRTKVLSIKILKNSRKKFTAIQPAWHQKSQAPTPGLS
ncbi:hypothetical protein SB48_HM08orf03559 [Heyndrickxia coagulans]|uniref:Uncharacterized protein n=1 Tax=Heyndrickxia coagulans TaxID=1398 RepID=A0AAN0T7J3_HEYCO|nr:hypothetical protein SB48_HM08orf03559 [Heyndrickxia coagulans]